ncbi:hypothetical protein Syun_005034 [Stephania yunnanensis]|uniref:Uncharacterized protein n=1 Tax=Stephania yunnanensis TaxID=152371 RepID=A0AAP0L5J3_9MAGN
MTRNRLVRGSGPAQTEDLQQQRKYYRSDEKHSKKHYEDMCGTGMTNQMKNRIKNTKT